MSRNVEEFLIETGKRIEKERIKKNLTIEELAEKSHIKAQYLKKIEAGKAVRMTTNHLDKICNALEIKAYDLLNGI